MAVENLITEHIDIWTSAVKTKSASGRGSSKKLELYGIKKLRELILELAIRGKLVPQDPSDEPASVLLERIAQERAQLIKDKKIKRSKKLPPVAEEDLKDDLPLGWQVSRLGEFVSIIRGITFPASAKHNEPESNLIACLRTANVQTQLDWDDLIYVERSYVKREEQMLAVGDIVMSMANSRELVGKVSYTYFLPKNLDVSFGGFLSVIRPYQLDSAFLMMVLRSPSVRDELVGSSSQTTNIANISLEKLNPLVVSIPPLKEQQRIVAKVDELMALCDQLEQQTEDSIEAHQVLVTTLLDTLTSSANADELMQNWARISEHFDTLFTTEESIDQLKQTILQLAVMGKLVPQDPTDEPAAKLLERIAEEKAQLVKEKKIKKQKALPPIAEDEKPFELPSGWEWCRLGQIGYDLGGGTPSKSNSKYWDGEIPWVSPKDMKVDFIESAIDTVTEKAIKETTIKLIPKNSLLMVVRGMILAHSFPVALTNKDVVINQDMKALVFSNIDPHYLLTVMKATKTTFTDLVDRSSHGTCKLISEKLWNVTLAIPPLNEQKKINMMLEQIMDICEQLKQGIRKKYQNQLHLTDTIVEQAV
ncbi:restriction endonuclease subunit S [Vibrio vulnificus]|uniref:restriction endonuclease subunit S n=1 Tax=Vibrio vulnificus TaxID=672 RepID=UPI0005F18485|nr:restriction endonuclease subunit S [Vibrio vulnificus]MCA3910894.1 restriction endonuclease subunit S [Vibrio vulnificus]OJI50246.1 Type-1 restriction enzyme EcoKI specificity protein [Vibrio vulnificus]OJI60002.1 Type-1 restriction enzyme EcoKI specificity protein [Vibrio fluvialis]POB27175.1 restriction endonuclease [Vibrio vulnificus]